MSFDVPRCLEEYRLHLRDFQFQLPHFSEDFRYLDEISPGLGPAQRYIAGIFQGLGWDNGLLPGLLGWNQLTGILLDGVGQYAYTVLQRTELPKQSDPEDNYLHSMANLDNGLLAGLGWNHPTGILRGPFHEWSGTMVYYQDLAGTSGQPNGIMVGWGGTVGLHSSTEDRITGQWSLSGVWVGPAHRYISRIIPGLGWDNGLLLGLGWDQPTGISPGFVRYWDHPNGVLPGCFQDLGGKMVYCRGSATISSQVYCWDRVGQ